MKITFQHCNQGTQEKCSTQRSENMAQVLSWTWTEAPVCEAALLGGPPPPPLLNHVLPTLAYVGIPLTILAYASSKRELWFAWLKSNSFPEEFSTFPALRADSKHIHHIWLQLLHVPRSHNIGQHRPTSEITVESSTGQHWKSIVLGAWNGILCSATW